jgi:hypothetical protein
MTGPEAWHGRGKPLNSWAIQWKRTRTGDPQGVSPAFCTAGLSRIYHLTITVLLRIHAAARASRPGGRRMTDSHDNTIAGAQNRDNQPVTIIFLSYASEDEDIVTAMSQSLDRLKQLSNGNIRTIYDKKSLEVGAPVPLSREISDKLLGSDYLVLLYTSSLKKSFSWTGTELGIFRGFIRSDERDFGTSRRKIIAIYFDEKPPVDWGALGISLEITSLDLRLPRDQFKQNVAKAIREGHKYDSLLKTFMEIGAAADERLPQQLERNSVLPGE